MSKATHMRGPWTVQPAARRSHTFIVIGPGGYEEPIAVEEVDATARLISAAPTMKSLLERATGMLPGSDLKREINLLLEKINE